MQNSEISKTRVSVFMAISLDGFIARTDGDVSWLDEYDLMGEGEDGGYGDLFQAVDVMVMGRRSFEKVLTFNNWPYGAKPIIVLSKSLTEIPVELRGSVRNRSFSSRRISGKAGPEWPQTYLPGWRPGGTVIFNPGIGG